MSAVRVKFCGLVRPADVEYATELGADFVGAVLAGGPRQRSAEQVRALFAGAPRGPHRVAVLGGDWHKQAAELLRTRAVDVLQLHSDPDAADVADARAAGAQEVWAVLRIGPTGVAPAASALFRAADAVVLDSRHASGLGGTGTSFEWERVAEQLSCSASGAMIVLAGGLTPENVARAVTVLRPAVVDVSSGVESAPGVKDRAKMLAFMDAARGSS